MRYTVLYLEDSATRSVRNIQVSENCRQVFRFCGQVTSKEGDAWRVQYVQHSTVKYSTVAIAMLGIKWH